MKLTAFNISIVLMVLFIFMGYQDRGYFAFGGEWMLPIIGYCIHHIVKDLKVMWGDE